MFKKAIVLLLVCMMLLTGCKGGVASVTSDSSSETQVSSEPLSSEDTFSDEVDDTSSETDTENNQSEESQSDNNLEEDNSGEETLDIDFDDFDFGDLDFDFSIDEEEEEELAGEDIRPKGNTSVLMNPIKGGADAKAEKLRNEILKNTNDVKPKDKKFVFYISEKNGDDDNDGTSPETAWKTTDALSLNMYKISYGATILFERGGMYRVRSSVQLKSGVTYGAYGKGEKPMICGSLKNYANEMLWRPSTKKYVWYTDTPHYMDIGNIVFEHGKYTGFKKNKLANLTKNFYFYCDDNNGRTYLYYDKGNPGKLFKSMELCQRIHLMHAVNAVDVTIDNIALRYSGSFGISFSWSAKNVKVTNCDIGWIGGSYMPNSGGSRYGNGIEFYNSAVDVLVENCWVYQVYDAGITNQGNAGNDMINVTFKENLVEYCTWNIETWNDGVYKDQFFTDNILRFAGYGWGNQRDVREYDSNINCWNNNYATLENMQIKGNIFDCANGNLIHWKSGEEQKGVTFSGNTWYQNMSGIAAWKADRLQAENQAEMEAIIKQIDANPIKVQWIG